VGFRVFLRCRITQHEKDIKLMNLIANFLGVGRVETQANRTTVNFVVTKISDLNQTIVPFFNQNPIFGVKSEDYSD
jgi:hypothetical protein